MSFAHYVKIHDLLGSLRTFSNPTEALSYLPENGIYFFYQKGETFKYGRRTYQRIVRVGINDVDGNFANRLRQHYQHRGASSFRDHLYDALSNTNQGWKRRSEDRQLSCVTDYLESNFWFRIIALPSAKRAKFWERKIISTIAPYSSQHATRDWLGLWANNENVSLYGLWNSEYTKAFQHEFIAKDMQTFEVLITRETARLQRIPRRPL